MILSPDHKPPPTVVSVSIQPLDDGGDVADILDGGRGGRPQ